MNYIKSKQRVADHGEVFTPAWLVEAMLDLVKGETERIDARFLEPACGSGNFLVPILQRKLAAVQLKYEKSAFERCHYALLGLMCIYGIELLADNIDECRANLLAIFAAYLHLTPIDDLYRAAWYVLSQNLVHGDALTMRAHGDQQHLADPVTRDRAIRPAQLQCTALCGHDLRLQPHDHAGSTQPVRDFGAVALGHALAKHCLRLDQRHAHPARCKQVGRLHTDRAATDDGDAGARRDAIGLA